jgi:TonB family protein
MCCAGVAFANEDTLAQAKDLYATAAYDEALAVLDRLQSQAAGNESTAIAEYRVFCLVALDRRDEARRTIEAILTENPQYRPSEDLASPRIQTVFRDTRRQLLPTIVRDRYAAAKAAFERKDPRAGDSFAAVLTLLDDPDVSVVPALADLRTVVSAFRDLTTAMAVPAIVRAADSPPQFPSAPAPVMGSNTIYTVEDADVIPPMPIAQRVPRWAPPRAYAQQDFRGTLEVLVDEQGAVTSASLRARVHPAYDADLLKAVRTWKFAPATKQGVPVRYLKSIDIRLTPARD